VLLFKADQTIAEVDHVVERGRGNLVLVNHAVQRERASTMVRDHAIHGAIILGNGVDRHAIHAWKEVGSERGREPPFLLLRRDLGAQESSLLDIFGCSNMSVVGGRVAREIGIGAWPETLPESSYYGLNEDGVGMIFE
jgi:hypothetical protein